MDISFKSFLSSIFGLPFKKEESIKDDSVGLCKHLKGQSYYGRSGRINYLGRVHNIVTAYCKECDKTWIQCEDAREWTIMKYDE